MAILNRSALRARGAAAAEGCRLETRRLVLIYCGVLALLTLGSNGLHLYLDSHIGSTGGLSGMGMRSVLETVQTVLSYINLFFGPFWTAGFLYAMLVMVRGQNPGTGDLMEGFRRFGRVLGQMAFQFLILMAMIIAVVNVATVIFSFTPMMADFTEKMEPLLSDPEVFSADGQLDLTKIPLEAMLSASMPLLILTAVLLIPVCIWLTYGLRMSMYLVMERPIGGIRACVESMRLMKGHKWQMFRLDLSFWWYHGLALLIGLVGYLDVALTMLGIPLPMDATMMFFLTLGAYCVLQTGLFLWKKCQVDAAYVLAYEAIAHPEKIECE